MPSSKKLSIQPLWAITLGLILLAASYFLGENIIWWLTRILQVIGLLLVVFGIILASAKLNSKNKI